MVLFKKDLEDFKRPFKRLAGGLEERLQRDFKRNLEGDFKGELREL